MSDLSDSETPFDSDFESDFESDDKIFTENGAVAHKSTGNTALDFFTRIVRGAPEEDYIPLFIKAFNEDNKLAIQLLMNLRDVRNGKGEKKISQKIMFLLKVTNKSVYNLILKDMVDLGYWKDLLVLSEYSDKYRSQQETFSLEERCTYHSEVELFIEQLQKDKICLNTGSAISLAGKWAPSEKSYYDKRNLKLGSAIRHGLQMSNKEYRQFLVKLRKHLEVLESYMSTGQYEKIKFSHIPSIAHKNYRKAFNRDCNAKEVKSEERKELSIRYSEYLSSLKSGETKINATGLHPHQLVETYFNIWGDYNDIPLDETVEEQWKVVSKKIADKGSFDKCVSVVDVSGSMAGEPMQVAIALGILVAENTKGNFNNRMITFHERPSWFEMKGKTLKDKVCEVSKMDWGGNTDIERVFDLILNHAKMYNLSSEQMVETLFIFTDMQFDQCDRTGGKWETTFETIKNKYKQSGYTPPKIICWNLRSSRCKTLPFTDKEENVACLSGFSSELLKSVMDMDDLDPMSVFLKIMNNYNPPDFPKTTIETNYLDFLKSI